jgi:protein-S-isoprenylcysteine O-methyltransferase Ste14
MSKERIVETATYIVVALAIWVFSPLLGKCIDSLYWKYPQILSDSITLLLTGLFIILAGTALSVWTILLFRTKGRGTPNPKLPPKVFVVTGPYRFSRNPMALGGLLVLLGEAIFYYSPTLLVIAVLFGIIVYFNAKYIEEPELRKRFGKSYEDYSRRVPRFFPSPWEWYR